MYSEAIRQLYRELDRDLALCVMRFRNQGPYEYRLWSPTDANRSAFQKEICQLQQRIQELAAGEPALELLRHHFSQVAAALELELRRYFLRPGEYFFALAEMTYEYYCRIDSRPDTIRSEILMGRLSCLEALCRGVSSYINQLTLSNLLDLYDRVRVFRSSILAEMPRLAGQYFTALEAGQLAALHDASQQAVDLCGSLMQQVADLLGEAPAVGDTDTYTVGLDHAYYRELLEKEFDIDLDELLSWYEQEVERTRAALYAAAQTADPEHRPVHSAAEVNALLRRYVGCADSGEDMLARARHYLLRSQAAVREILDMPPEDCEILPIPEIRKGSSAWGGYDSICPLRRPLKGNFFLNQDNYRAISDGWLKTNALHEAYPGHHCQYVRSISAPLPHTMKLEVGRQPSFMEGAAVRSESAFAWIYADDPFYPVHAAYRQHHTSVRIKADLLLRYFDRPVSDAVELYMKELDFDRHTARLQVKQQEEMEAYFTCYYYGYKKLRQWEQESGLRSLDYTRLLFDMGRVSLSTFKRYLDLSPEERRQVMNDFSSLLDEGGNKSS